MLSTSIKGWKTCCGAVCSLDSTCSRSRYAPAASITRFSTYTLLDCLPSSSILHVAGARVASRGGLDALRSSHTQIATGGFGLICASSFLAHHIVLASAIMDCLPSSSISHVARRRITGGVDGSRLLLISNSYRRVIALPHCLRVVSCLLTRYPCYACGAL